MHGIDSEKYIIADLRGLIKHTARGDPQCVSTWQSLAQLWHKSILRL